MTTYYNILGVHADATSEDIKKAFRRLAKEYHPDVNKSPRAQQMFCDAYSAYEILTDSAKRKIYDSYLTDLARPQPPPSMREEQEVVRTWQTQAEARGQNYANMPYAEFVRQVLLNMAAVSVIGLVALGLVSSILTWIFFISEVGWFALVILISLIALLLLIVGGGVLDSRKNGEEGGRAGSVG